MNWRGWPSSTKRNEERRKDNEERTFPAFIASGVSSKDWPRERDGGVQIGGLKKGQSKGKGWKLLFFRV